MSALNEEEEFEFRLRAEQEAAQPSQIPSPEEQARLTHGDKVPNGEFIPQWKKNVSEVARPVLNTVGLVGGGLLAGAAATPETLGLGAIPAGVAGAGLGYAAGEQIANKLDEALGVRQAKPVTEELMQAGKDVGTGAAIEMGGQVAGKAIPLVAKGIGKAISAPLGATTGTGSGAIEEAFKNHPGFRQAMSGQVTEEGLVKTMNDKLASMAEQRGINYADSLKNLNVNVPINAAPIENTLFNRLKTFGVKTVTDPATGAISLDMKGSRGIGAVRSAASDAHKALQDFHAAGDYTPYGVDTLRMNLREIAGQSPQANSILKPVIKDIKKSVESVVPGYEKMLKDYETTTNQINELRKGLSITGEGASKDTAIRKLSTIFRDVNKYRLDKLNELDPDGTLKAQAAGIALKSGLPRGLIAKYFGAGEIGVLGALVNPSAAVAAGLSSSPRVVGEAANLAGKAYRAIPDKTTEAFIRALILRNAEQQ